MINKSKISSFCKVRRGASPRPISDPKYFGGNVGWIRISDVTRSNKYLNETEQYVSPLGESLSVKVDKGDLIMSICATIGRPVIINIPACIHDGFVQLYDIKNADIEYLYYILNYHEKDFEGKGQPGTQINLNTTIVENFEIYFPILSIQRRISQILNTADAIIEKTQLAIAKYKAIKQGMLHDLFTRGIDVSTGKLRPTFKDAPEFYKESKLGMVPKDWEEGAFIDFADEKISHSFTGGPFGSDLQTKHYTKTGVRIIQLQNIGDGIFKDNYKIYTSEDKANQLINCNIYHGEIIIAKMADPIARACIIPDTEKRYLMASDGIRLSIDKKKFNSRFVLETINHKRFRNIAEIKATGSTRARIGLTELREIPVVYPDKKEQDQIGLRLDAIDNKIQAEQNYLHKLQQIKSGLMGDLLSGKKEVKLINKTEKMNQ